MVRRPAAALLLAALALPVHLRAQQPFVESATCKLFEQRSPLLSAFQGRDITIRAGVVVPADLREDERLPVVFNIHGFGGSHRSAMRQAPNLVEGMQKGTTPRMLYVFLDASCPLGHHEFADSVNNGPWGTALVTEFVPALEQRFHAFGAPAGRFLTGHSSGGWSSLWLMVSWPDVFAGTWSTAPDSVDFRDFTGIDVYHFANAFTDPEGKPIPLVRKNGEWAMTIREFVDRELARSDHGGQFMSFDAVFSPRGDDGRPMHLFEPKTGAIDRAVAESWKKYDIGLQLRERHAELLPKLRGKLHVYVGTQDTFRLEGALRLLAADLQRLGSDAEIVFAEGRDHGTLFQPHPELWPDGMMARIHREMRAKFDAATGAGAKGGAGAAGHAAGGDDALVFVLAGQSNMEGHAVVDLEGKDYNGGKGTLRTLLADPLRGAPWRHLLGADGAFTTRDDVYVRYQPQHGELQRGPLGIGYTIYGDRHHFGPELEFGHAVAEGLHRKVLLVKTAWGGKSLYADFRPPSAGGTVGPFYTQMITEVREALADKKAMPPGARTAKLAGFVWYQGWNDGCDPQHAVPEYEQNLVHLIRDVRRDLGAPELPVVVGELTGPWVDAPGEWGELRRAQAAIARHEELGRVAFVPTHEFVRKPEDSPNPGHGHHEFGNAETLLLVGGALGEAMCRLVGAGK